MSKEEKKIEDLLEETKKEFSLKLERIIEEQEVMEEEWRGRGMQKKVEYDSESGLLVSTNPEERESASWLGKYRSDPRRAPKREWAIVEEHICPNAPEVIIRHVDDTFHFDLLRTMVEVDEKGKDVRGIHGVRIPLKFCPFCGERLIKENKKEAVDTLDEIDEGGVIEKVAKLYRKLFDALVKEGFTEEQAIAIVVEQGL